MKKSEIRKETKRICDITITNKDAEAILKDLEMLEYEKTSFETTWLKKYLKDLVNGGDSFDGCNEKIESAEFFDSISIEEICKFYAENEPPYYDFNDNYEHRGYEFWAKGDTMSKENIEFLQSKIKRWGEFMYHLRHKSGKNNDLVQVVLIEDLKKKSIKIYMNGELVIEEGY